MSRRLLRIHSDGSRSWLQPPAGAAADSAAPLWVVVPAESVLLLETGRIAGSDAKLQQALPFLIEDQLAVPVETQHVAWSALPDPRRIAVAVVDRGVLEGWLAALREDGLQPTVLTPESVLLPWREGVASVLVEGDRALARLGPTRAFCGSRSEVEGMLAMQALAEERIVVGVAADAGGRRVDRALDVYAEAIQAGPQPLINLLQGAFAARVVRADLRRARAVAAVALLAAFALALAHVGIERSQLSSQAQAQRAEMVSLYQRLVPDATPPASPEAFLASTLQATGRGEAPLLQLLDGLAPVMSELGCCRLHSLEYRNRSLEAVVTAADVAALDELRARLAATGLAAELTAATPGSQGVEGRLRLGGSAP